MRLIRLLKNDLARESAEWVDENIISTAQAEQISQRYGVDYHQAQSRSLGYMVLVGLAYLFIGLAVITLLGHNWDEIPRALRMGGLIIITLIVQALALRKQLAGQEGGATALFLLGNMLYGASIILIAQIYHLGEHMPDGIYWWALGSLPFALLLKNPWLMLQSLLLAVIWFMVESSMGFYPLTFPLFIIAALYVLRNGRQSMLLFLLSVVSIIGWFEYSMAELWREPGRYDFSVEHIALGAALFIFAHSVSQWLAHLPSPTARDYGALLSVWCLRFALVFMLVMSFELPWEGLLTAQWRHSEQMIALLLPLLGGALFLAYRNGRLQPTITFVGYFLLILTFVMVSEAKDDAVTLQVVDNIALVAAGGWLIIRGIHHGISHYFFLGVATILITALLRYIDLIGNYLGAAALFIVFALLLLGAARYWKMLHNREEAK
ncbi:MAG: DUF2157 domain-containing protein [Pseudomonadota bacterium]